MLFFIIYEYLIEILRTWSYSLHDHKHKGNYIIEKIIWLMVYHKINKNVQIITKITDNIFKLIHK